MATDGIDNKVPVVLVASGSFNPITNMHLRLFEVARDALHATGRYQVIRGIISPVSDGYAKEGLISAKDRCAMVKLATSSSDWIKLDSWEADQKTWSETVFVLRHIRQTLQDLHQNNVGSAESAAKRRKISKTDSSTVLLNSTNRPVEVKFLCGADVLESFNIPGLWKPEHREEILSSFGVVACQRSSSSLEKVIYESDLMTKYKSNVTVVTEWITNEISSTKIRRALSRGDSVRYLIQDSVIDYICKHNLYSTTSTTVTKNKLMNHLTVSPCLDQLSVSDTVTASLVSDVTSATSQPPPPQSVIASRQSLQATIFCPTPRPVGAFRPTARRVHDIYEHKSAFLRSQSLDYDPTTRFLDPYRIATNHASARTSRGYYRSRHRRDVADRDEQSWHGAGIRFRMVRSETDGEALDSGVDTNKSNDDAATIDDDVRSTRIEYYFRDNSGDVVSTTSAGSSHARSSREEPTTGVIYPAPRASSAVNVVTTDIEIANNNNIVKETSFAKTPKKKKKRKSSLESIASVEEFIGEMGGCTAPPRMSRIGRTKRAVSSAISDIVGLVRRLKRFNIGHESGI